MLSRFARHVSTQHSEIQPSDTKYIQFKVLPAGHFGATAGFSTVNPPALAAHAQAATASDERSFAVISVGPSQFKVTEGDVLIVDRVQGATVGQEFIADKVHLVGSAAKTVVGRPLIPGAMVRLACEQETASKHIRVFKNRQRSTFRKTKGFRRLINVFRVKSIECEAR